MSWTLDHGCSYGHGFISWEFIHCLLLISIFTWLWYPIIHTCYIWAQLFCLLWSSFAFMHDLSITPLPLWWPDSFVHDLSTTPLPIMRSSLILAWSEHNSIYLFFPCQLFLFQYTYIVLLNFTSPRIDTMTWYVVYCGHQTGVFSSGENAMQVSMASREPVTKDTRLKKLWLHITTKRVLKALLIKSLLTART